MSINFIHNEYFRERLPNGGLQVFQNVNDALARMGFADTFFTCGNPQLSYILQDNNTTFKVVMEFDTQEDQDFWKKSVDALGPGFRNNNIEFFKIEWCDSNGIPESTTLHES